MTTATTKVVMDLSAVKAAVKTWEKSFKAKHGRDPTKEDIKTDSSGICEFLLGRQEVYTDNICFTS